LARASSRRRVRRCLGLRRKKERGADASFPACTVRPNPFLHRFPPETFL
jgi:hypothetical protein